MERAPPHAAHFGHVEAVCTLAGRLGIPAVVGAGNATEKLKKGDNVTVSCSEGAPGMKGVALCRASSQASRHVA